MCEYQKIEEGILNEKPYNPKKHFLFHVPEMIAQILTFVLYMGVFWVIVIASIQSTAEVLPALCSKLNL